MKADGFIGFTFVVAFGLSSFEEEQSSYSALRLKVPNLNI